jgi:hypothetical protein
VVQRMAHVAERDKAEDRETNEEGEDPQ